jgi:hypothetical protein
MPQSISLRQTLDTAFFRNLKMIGIHSIFENFTPGVIAVAESGSLTDVVARNSEGSTVQNQQWEFHLSALQRSGVWSMCRDM